MIEGYGVGTPDYENPGTLAALQATLEMGFTFMGYVVFLVGALCSGKPGTIKLALWSYAIVDIMAALAGVLGPATNPYVLENAVACLVLATIFIAATFYVPAEGYEPLY